MDSNRARSLGQLAAFTDVRFVDVLLYLDPLELIRLQSVSHGFYLFCNIDAIWAGHATLIAHKPLDYLVSWKRTYLSLRFPEKALFPLQPPLTVTDFTTQFLYLLWYRSNMVLTGYYPPVQGLPRIPLSSLTLDDFVRKWETPCAPCVLTGGIDVWPALKLWSLDGLVGICGDTEFTFSSSFWSAGMKTKYMGGKPKSRVKMTMKQYVNYMVQQHDESPLYMFERNFGEMVPELLRHYCVADLKVFPEDLFETLGESRPDFRWLVIGPARTGASWHVDPSMTSAWNALLRGRKRWALYPPTKVPPGVEVNQDEFGRVVDGYSEKSSLLWYLEIYPTLKPEDKPIEIVQEAGEVVFVPRGWWHMILNLEDTVSVTQNYVNQQNLPQVIEDMVASENRNAISTPFHAAVEGRFPQLSALYRLSQTFELEKCSSNFELMKSFTRASKWLKVVQGICRFHDLPVPEKSTSGSCREKTHTMACKGSRANGVFVVTPSDTECNVTGFVVKLYSPIAIDCVPQFNQCAEIEADCLRLLAESAVPAPTLIASGTYRPVDDTRGWLWPYTVQSFIAGKSFRLTGIDRLPPKCGDDPGTDSDDSCGDSDSDESAFSDRSADDAVEGDETFWNPLLDWLGRQVAAIHCVPNLEAVEEAFHGTVEVCVRARLKVPSCEAAAEMPLPPPPSLAARSGLGQSAPGLVSKWIGGPFVAISKQNKAGGWKLVSTEPPAEPGPLLPLYWHSFALFLRRQREACVAIQLRHGSLPPHLVAQIDAYLPDASNVHTLISDTTVPPSLLHGDLNDDNILGSGKSLAWKPCGIIDFADALSGDPLYDFVAIFVSCFRCDKQRLKKFLLAYMRSRGWTMDSKEVARFRATFSYRMMCYMLFQPVNVLATATVFRASELQACATLQEVEHVLWSLDGVL